MNDESLLRYARHVLLDAVGIEGQERLLQSHALIVGAGGLGSPVALYLAASGVGTVSVVDPDTVDMTNLQRQVAHTSDRVGVAKAPSARVAMLAINPTITVHAHVARADASWLNTHVPTCQVVIDCSDNFATRQAVNAACVQHGVPLVSGSALRFSGQLMTVLPAAATPCYACAFDPSHPLEEQHCATQGVWAPLVGLVGTLQANEALKLLAGLPTAYHGGITLIEALDGSQHRMSLQRKDDCPVCGVSHRS